MTDDSNPNEDCALPQRADLSGRRTLVVEIADEGDAITLRFADAPLDPLAMPSRTAMTIGMALQRASTIAGCRGATAPERRSMARCREEHTQRMARAVDVEIVRRGGRAA